MTINQYISNPFGKGAAASSLRVVKTEYDARYEALLDIHEQFHTHIYKHRNSYYFHVLVPSETTKELFYDVVIKIDRVPSAQSNFLNWPMKAISNSPSFVFTFANTFKRNRMIIDELKSVIPSKTITDPAKVRNPNRLLGLEKSIYFACKYIKETISNINDVESFASDLNLKSLLKEIKEFDDVMKIKEIDQKKKSEEKKRQAEKLKKENQKVRTGKQDNDDSSLSRIVIKRVPSSSIPKKAPSANKAKKAKRI